ncbi:MAG: hypothetical protein U0105_25985 [Candidatus Obscuribacterales bacterium]
MSEHNFDHIHMKEKTDGAKIVDAIAAGDTNRLQDAVNGLTPDELKQVYVQINQENAARQAEGLLPVTVIVNDQDHDGRIDVTGTNTKTGLTIGAEGKTKFEMALEEMVLDDRTAKTASGVGGKFEAGGIGGGAKSR